MENLVGHVERFPGGRKTGRENHTHALESSPMRCGVVLRVILRVIGHLVWIVNIEAGVIDDVTIWHFHSLAAVCSQRNRVYALIRAIRVIRGLESSFRKS